MNLRPVQPVNQRQQLRAVHLHAGVPDARPAEAVFFETLGEQAQAGAAGTEEPSGAAAKDEDVVDADFEEVKK